MVPLVLAVDDEMSNHILLRAYLKAEHFRADFVGKCSGAEAMEFLQQSPSEERSREFPELIFLDIHMPEMDGWEFLDVLTPIMREKEKLPVSILLSATTTAEDIEQAAAHFMVEDITCKPLDSEYRRHLQQNTRLPRCFGSTNVCA